MADNEQLARRLGIMLERLYQRQALDRQILAVEFGVTERTIYRDLQRLGDIICLREDGLYELAPGFGCRIEPRHLQALVTLLGSDGLFPEHGTGFLLPLLDGDRARSYLVKGPAYEHERASNRAFQTLDDAIRDRLQCHIVYADKARTIAPYRLVNQHGIWYLVAMDAGVLKTFTLQRCTHLAVTATPYLPDPAIDAEITHADSIWFGPKTLVTLRVTGMAMYYFRRRDLVPSQTTVEEADDHLLIRTEIRNPEQILPIVRYWIPHVRIVSPADYATRLHRTLTHYLDLETQAGATPA